jgi:DNA-binding MarR family transcriptional regulator
LKQSKYELASEVWRHLFDFIIRTRAHRDRALERYNLTPNDSRALFSLDADGRPIGELSHEWACDPSNATWIIDRLEAAGLAERRPDVTDRRVKRVALTKKGVRTKEAMRSELYDPPEELVALKRVDLERLLAAAQTLDARDTEAGLRE